MWRFIELPNYWGRQLVHRQLARLVLRLAPCHGI
jgi:hypothetical protein